MSRKIYSVLLASLVLSACATAPLPRQTRVEGIGPTMYEATEQLRARSRVPLTDGQLVLVSTLVDSNDLNRSAPLGRLVSQLISSRLVQEGYIVRDVTYTRAVDVQPGTGELVLSREARLLGTSSRAEVVVAGTYTVAGSEIWLNMRLLKADDGAVLSSVDVVLPLDLNTRKLVCSVAGGNGLERCADIPR